MSGRPTSESARAQISVRLTPRGGRDAIEGWEDGCLRVRVAAPPVDGQANQVLLRLIAEAVGCPPSRVAIVAGATSRLKRVVIMGLTQEEAEHRLR